MTAELLLICTTLIIQGFSTSLQWHKWSVDHKDRRNRTNRLLLCLGIELANYKTYNHEKSSSEVHIYPPRFDCWAVTSLLEVGTLDWVKDRELVTALLGVKLSIEGYNRAIDLHDKSSASESINVEVPLEVLKNSIQALYKAAGRYQSLSSLPQFNQCSE